MAEASTQFNEEEKRQIGALLEPLEGEFNEKAFSPMLEQFTADKEQVARLFEPEPEAPVDDGTSAIPEGTDTGLFGLGGDDMMPAGDADAVDSGLSESTPSDGGFGDLGDLGDLGGGDFGGEPAPTTTTDDLGEFTDLGDLGGGDAAPTTSPDVGGDFGDLGDLGGGDLGGEPAPTTTPDFGGDLGDLGDLGGGDSTPTASPDLGGDFGDLGDLGGGDLGGEPAPTTTPDFGGDLGDLGDLGGGDSTPTASPELGGDFGDLGDLGGGDLGGEPAPTTTPDFGGDLGDLGDLGGGDSTPTASPDLSGDFGDLGGLGDLGGEPAPTTTPDFGGDLGDLGDLGGGTSDAGFGDVAAEPAGMDTGSSFSSPEDDLGLASYDDISSDAGLGTPTEFSDSSLSGDSSLGDLSAISDSGDLAAMTEQAQLDQGIGDEFTNEDLAKIRTNLNDYPAGIKKSSIDAIVNEKISRPDQRLLVNMIIDQAQPESIADFLESRIGYRPDTTPANVRKDGIPIVYTDDVSPEDMARRRRRAKVTVIGAGVGFALIGILFGAVYFYQRFSVRGTYERGLAELTKARDVEGEVREEHRKRALEFFEKAREADGGRYNVDYLNRYGIAFMKAGFYEDAFVKLYGKVKPDYGDDSPESAWNKEGQRAPLIRIADGSSWPSPREEADGRRATFTARDGVKRVVEMPGAYIVSRLRDNELHRGNLMALARFHSNNAGSFLKKPEGRKFKNDGLGIDYYRLILTLMNKPDDVEATAGIGQIFYNRKEFGAAAREYNRILEKHPMEVAGQAGLLNTYMEIWKGSNDPRLVIAQHRRIRSSGLEEKLPIFTLAKLAGFYTELDRDDVRIKYQVDPVDAMTGMDLKDNAAHVLEILFHTKETRDEDVVDGSKYGEGFYRRGMFLIAQKESQRALRQFQNAHEYDPHHYLAVAAMGDYYKGIKDFARAEQYYTEALRTYKRFSEDYGGRPEDETLAEGDAAKLYHNLGSLVFLKYAGIQEEGSEGFRDTRIYPDRAIGDDNPDIRKRREQLLQARSYFEQALKEGMKDKEARVEAMYWTGWIDYTNADFAGALDSWENIESEAGYSDPVLLMAKGNAYFYTDQIRAALGNYLKVQSDAERELLIIGRPDSSNTKHRMLHLTLAAAYNNVGAIYEREYLEGKRRGASPRTLADLEKTSLLHYWHAVETSRKVELDNEIARTNVQLAFKTSVEGREKERLPLIDDWVSPVLTKEAGEKK